MEKSVFFRRYLQACKLTQSVHPRRVRQALKALFKNFGVHVTVSEVGSFRSVFDAWVDRIFWSAGEFRAACAFRAAWDGSDARAARANSAAWSAGTVRAARAVGAARAAGIPWDVRTSWAVGDTWDLSYNSCLVLGAEALGKTDEQVKWQPCFEAFEAGGWLVFPIDTTVLWMRIPLLSRNTRNQLHAEGRAAVTLKDERWHFLWGVFVEPWMAETPAEQLDVQQVLGIQNVRQRTVVMKRLGIERFIQQAGAREIDAQDEYVLLEISLNHRPARYLKMRNPSVGVWHVEGVPNTCETVAEALRSRWPPAMRALPVRTDGAEWYEQGDVCIWPKGATALQPSPKVLT